MDCKEFRELLDLHVDRELSSEAEASARLHAQECAGCRSVERQLLRLRASLKQLVAKNEPPMHLISEVQKVWQPWWKRSFHISERQTRNRFWNSRVELRAPVLGLFLLIMCAFAFLLGQRLTSLPETPSAKNEAIQAEKTPGSESGLMDLSRFDLGGRVTVYKTLANQ